MKITKLSVRNFKSFNKLDLELGDFNVFIGANASGKSNFFHILEFLRDIASSGLDNAVSMQGDVEFLRNINIGAEDETYVKIVFDPVSGMMLREGELIAIAAREASYTLSLKHYKRAKGFRISQDLSRVQTEYVEFEKTDGELKEKEIRGKGISSTSNVKGEIKISHTHEGASLEKDLLEKIFLELPFSSKVKSLPRLPKKEALLGSPFFGFPFFFMKRSIEDISVYDFDSKVQKKASPISGKTDLEEDGSNVALVLKHIIEDKEKRFRFINLIQDVLPFVESIGVEKFAGRSLIVKLKETHLQKYLPASLLSDGTVKLVSLLIVLYFEYKPMVLFEEPGSNLHPHLISKVVSMMKEQAQHKQLFITTHNPEVVKHAGLENLYLVSRDKNGFSKITRPKNSEEVKIFLEHEMGLDDLFVQNLLEL